MTELTPPPPKFAAAQTSPIIQTVYQPRIPELDGLRGIRHPPSHLNPLLYNQRICPRHCISFSFVLS